ncbi:hypothetical protein GGI22_003606, partial [Coemansia erecta]
MDATDTTVGANIDSDNHGVQEVSLNQTTATTTTASQPGSERTEENESVSVRRSEYIDRGATSTDSELRLRRRRESDLGETAIEEARTTARREDKGKHAGTSTTDSTGDDATKTDAQQPASSANDEFSCNICFDTATDPVLTICGHLFCWPCLAQWLERSATCPVCKAGCDKDKVIPVYGRGKDKTDPRLNPNIPSRPAGQRPPAPQRQQNQFFGFDPFGVPGSFHGIGGGISMGRMGGSTHTYIGGFGILPALMGFSSFPINPAGNTNNAGGPGAPGVGQQAGQQAFASRVLMMLAAMILM